MKAVLFLAVPLLGMVPGVASGQSAASRMAVTYASEKLRRNWPFRAATAIPSRL
jgi:hypothetical protein